MKQAFSWRLVHNVQLSVNYPIITLLGASQIFQKCNVLSHFFVCLFYCLWSNVIYFDKTWQTVETTFYLILLEESHV